MSETTEKLLKMLYNVIDANAYREGLGPQERARYLEKLRFIGGADPYELPPSLPRVFRLLHILIL